MPNLKFPCDDEKGIVSALRFGYNINFVAPAIMQVLTRERGTS